jgi:elongation factor P--beta-lysine ligase
VQKSTPTAEPEAAATFLAPLVPERMPYSTVGREATPEAEMASRNNLFEQYLAQQQLQQQVQQQIQQSQGAHLQQRQQRSEDAALQLYFQQHMEYQTRKDTNVRLSQTKKRSSIW